MATGDIAAYFTLIFGVTLQHTNSLVIPDAVYNDSNSASIPNDLMQDLSYIYITGTSISVLNMEQFQQYQNMYRLDLSNTPLQTIIPTVLSNTPKLKALVLNSCPLIGPPEFGELTRQLKDLEISDCGQDDLPENYFDNFGTNLLSLNLRNNEIRQVKPAWFKTITRVRSLVLSGNPLGIIPEVHNWLPNLKKLNINEIGAEFIEDYLLIGLPNLVTFGMSDNKLKSIPERALFEPVADMARINFQDNPLVCDERLCWVKELNADEAPIVQISETPCVEPSELVSVPWVDITLYDLGCGIEKIEVFSSVMRSTNRVFLRKRRYLLQHVFR